MPHFMLPTTQGRILVKAAILASAARRKALEGSGLPVPEPQNILALLDTGASISAVDPSVLATLGLTATGKAEIHTPSTQGVALQADTYDVAVGIYAARRGDTHFVSDTIQVTACILSGGCQALIGTDILKSCILTYNGSDENFTLAW